MIKLTYIQPDGTARMVEASEGQSIMQAALNNLVPGIIGECGGELSCATCHVFVDPAWISKAGPLSDQEADLLETTSEATNECSRLACQIRLSAELDGIMVEVPRTQR